MIEFYYYIYTYIIFVCRNSLYKKILLVEFCLVFLYNFLEDKMSAPRKLNYSPCSDEDKCQCECECKYDCESENKLSYEIKKNDVDCKISKLQEVIMMEMNSEKRSTFKESINEISLQFKKYDAIIHERRTILDCINSCSTLKKQIKSEMEESNNRDVIHDCNERIEKLNDTVNKLIYKLHSDNLENTI